MKKVFIVFLTLFVLCVSTPVYADDVCGTDAVAMDVDACNNIGGIPTKCGIPSGLAGMINDAFNLLKIGVPVVLIIIGMIDLLKAVAGQKEEDIKKGWNMFAKRVIYGIAVFFVFFLVQFVVSLLPGKSGKADILSCVKTFFGYGGETQVCCITKGANTKNNDKNSNENNSNETDNNENNNENNSDEADNDKNDDVSNEQ